MNVFGIYHVPWTILNIGHREIKCTSCPPKKKKHEITIKNKHWPIGEKYMRKIGSQIQQKLVVSPKFTQTMAPVRALTSLVNVRHTDKHSYFSSLLNAIMSSQFAFQIRFIHMEQLTSSYLIRKMVYILTGIYRQTSWCLLNPTYKLIISADSKYQPKFIILAILH